MKVQSASIHFFLGSDDEKEDSDDEEDEVSDVYFAEYHSFASRVPTSEHFTIVVKSTKRHVLVIKSFRKSSTLQRRYPPSIIFQDLSPSVVRFQKKHNQNASTTPNFPALQLLNDPQTFAEKLYDNLSRYDKRFSLEHKILIMQLLSRVMGAHKLCVLSFYTYIVKYLTYHQLRVPSILVALAQSVHDLTPPDALTPILQKLAGEFVHPGVGSEVIAAGINAIREVCRRQPWAIEEDLLGDLVEYRKSRDKTVTAAARGLLQLYREVNPGMLKRRERVSNFLVNPSI